MKQGLLLLGLVNLTSLWAVDIDSVVHDVRDVLLRQGPVAAVHAGYNACAGKTAGEIIGYTLGGAVGGEFLGGLAGRGVDWLSGAWNTAQAAFKSEAAALVIQVAEDEAKASKIASLLPNADSALLVRPSSLTPKVLSQLTNRVAFADIALTRAEALYLTKTFLVARTELTDLEAAAAAAKIVDRAMTTGPSEIKAAQLAPYLMKSNMSTSLADAFKPGPAGMDFLESQLLPEGVAEQFKKVLQKSFEGSKVYHAIKTTGTAAGTAVGLGTSVGMGVNAIDQCYQAVEKATGFVVDKYLYSGTRLGFLCIDNQTGKDITAKIYGWGWAQPQVFNVKAHGASDPRTLWALGPWGIDRIELFWGSTRIATLYRRGVVAINEVIGATVKWEDSTVMVHDPIGVSLP